MEREHIAHLKVARLLLRVASRLKSAIVRLTADGVEVKAEKSDVCRQVMLRLAKVQNDAAAWLSGRLQCTPPGELCRGARVGGRQDAEILDVMVDLLTPGGFSATIAKGLLVRWPTGMSICAISRLLTASPPRCLIAGVRRQPRGTTSRSETCP